MFIVIISPGRAVSATAATGASGATRPITIIYPGTLVLIRGDTVGKRTALSHHVVSVLMPGAPGIEEPVELLLVEGGALLWSIGDGDGVVEAVLTLAGLE